MISDKKGFVLVEALILFIITVLLVTFTLSFSQMFYQLEKESHTYHDKETLQDIYRIHLD